MIKIITGQTGEGKTKTMIEAANTLVKTLKGNAIYIDACSHHRYALSHQVRLIEANAFPLSSKANFIGFIYGLIAANHDIEAIFIDELITLTNATLDEVSTLFEEIRHISDKYDITFFIGTSCSNKDLPHHLTPFLIA